MLFRPLLAACLAGAFLSAVPALHTPAKAAPEKQEAEKKPIPEKWSFLGTPGIPQQIRDHIRRHLTPLIGQPAPALELADFRNVQTFSQEDFQGRITIVDLWATWCGPCLSAIPSNNALQEKYADQGVTVLGVTTSNGQEQLDRILADHPIHYPLAKDPKQKTLAAWKASFFPTYYVVDRDGIVRGVALNPAHLEEVVQFLLKEQPPKKTAPAENEEKS